MSSAGTASPKGGKKANEAAAFDVELSYSEANFNIPENHKNCAEVS